MFNYVLVSASWKAQTNVPLFSRTLTNGDGIVQPLKVIVRFKWDDVWVGLSRKPVLRTSSVKDVHCCCCYYSYWFYSPGEQVENGICQISVSLFGWAQWTALEPLHLRSFFRNGGLETGNGKEPWKMLCGLQVSLSMELPEKSFDLRKVWEVPGRRRSPNGRLWALFLIHNRTGHSLKFGGKSPVQQNMVNMAQECGARLPGFKFQPSQGCEVKIIKIECSAQRKCLKTVSLPSSPPQHFHSVIFEIVVFMWLLWVGELWLGPGLKSHCPNLCGLLGRRRSEAEE